MRRYNRKQLVAVLQSYPAMQNAMKNLDEQIRAEAEVVRIWRSRAAKSEQDEQELIDEHLFIIEDLHLRKNLLKVRMKTIERSLGALTEEERGLLEAFYLEPYNREKPFELMERFGYEKTQLYVRRGMALKRFGENLNGEGQMM